VHGKAQHAHARHVGGDRVEAVRFAEADAELVGLGAGRDLGVAAGADIRVDAEDGVLALAARGGNARERVQLSLGLDVDLVDARSDGEGEFVVALADAGENDGARGNAGGQRLADLASETVSAPAPRRASVASTPRLLFAFMAKKTRERGAPTARAKRV
jgi:hypothetical protein